jgi:type 1 fimbriae regulatory protein FimB
MVQVVFLYAIIINYLHSSGASNLQQNNLISLPDQHLTPEKVALMIEAAGATGRHGLRDQLIILLSFRHGLRVSELVSLRWSDIDLDSASIVIERLKRNDRGRFSNHPLEVDEIKLLRKFRKMNGKHEHVFTSERGTPLDRSVVYRIVRRAGEQAGVGAVHPHQLRHATGYYLANGPLSGDTRGIQHYLGHRSITSTVHYTDQNPDKFVGLFSKGRRS